jgi:hypothetical protein
MLVLPCAPLFISIDKSPPRGTTYARFKHLRLFSAA